MRFASRPPPPDEEALARLRARCAGQIGSWIDLLKGNLSPELLEILCAPEGGLFPAPEEWRFFLFLSGLGGFVQA